MRSFFIAGTDTGVGKTRISAALIRALSARGKNVMGMKPVATGCIRTGDGLRNPDAQTILACLREQVPYELVNPYAFEPPVAPIFAAAAANIRIEKDAVRRAFDSLSELADTVIVEGIGGWRVPLSAGLQMTDLVRVMDLDVILVVGLRLGCINHALLSVEAIVKDGFRLAGWVANQIDADYDGVQQTLDLIAGNCRAPLLGLVPYHAGAGRAGVDLELESGRLDVLMG